MSVLAHITVEDTWIVVAALVVGFAIGVAYVAGLMTGRRRAGTVRSRRDP